METGVSSGYAQSLGTNWRQWTSYCADIGLDPLLQNITNPVPFLQIFAHRVRSRKNAAKGRTVRKRTVAHYIRVVGQTISLLEAVDPRNNKAGETEFRLYRQLRSYYRNDPAPVQVKPLPIKIIDHVYTAAIRGDHRQQYIADMLWVAFYFIMRPGVYCDAGTDNNSTAFRVCDAVFRRGSTTFNTLTTKLATLITADHVALTFTTQKNGIQGKVIGQQASRHPTSCPVQRCLYHVTYL